MNSASLIRSSTIICLLLEVHLSLGQQTWSRDVSNYAGTHAMYQNPALLTNSRHRFYFNTFSTGSAFSNNFVKLSLPFSLKDYINGEVDAEYKNPNGGISLKSDWFTENLDGKPKGALFSLESRMPSFMYSAKRFGIAVGLRNRSQIGVSNISEKLARVFLYSSNSEEFNQYLSGAAEEDTRFNIKMSSFQEISATASVNFLNIGNLKLNAGATYKHLIGIGYAEVDFSGLAYQVYNNDSVVVQKARLMAAYSDNNLLEDFTSNTFNFNSLGSGTAIDFGGSFEITRETQMMASKSNYLLKGGLSIMDVGNVQFKPSSNTKVYRANIEEDVVINFRDSAYNNSGDSKPEYVLERLRENFSLDSSQKDFKVKLPKHLNFFVDYNIFRPFFLALVYNQAFNSQETFTLTTQTTLSLIPRFENGIVEISLPMTLNTKYQPGGIGAFIRIGPAYFGTNDFTKILNGKDIDSFSFYAGAGFGILRNKKKQSR